MARKKGGIGGGAKAMGGAGIGAAAGRPPTVMAGRSPMGAPGGLPGGLGGGGGLPGGAPRGIPAPGGQPVARSPAAGMGGAAGFQKGGQVGNTQLGYKGGGEVGEMKAGEEKQAFAFGGPVHHGKKPLDYPRKSEKADSQTRQMEHDHKPRSRHGEMEKQISEGKAGFKKGGSTAFARGGPVGLGGADTKARVGRDRPSHSGKSS